MRSRCCREFRPFRTSRERGPTCSNRAPLAIAVHRLVAGAPPGRKRSSAESSTSAFTIDSSRTMQRCWHSPISCSSPDFRSFQRSNGARSSAAHLRSWGLLPSAWCRSCGPAGPSVFSTPWRCPAPVRRARGCYPSGLLASLVGCYTCAPVACGPGTWSAGGEAQIPRAPRPKSPSCGASLTPSIPCGPRL